MALSSGEKYKIDPGLAAVFSFLFSGLGQIYNGQIRKGITVMIFSALGMVTVIVGFVQIIFSFIPKLLAKGDLLLGAIILVVGILLMAMVGIYAIYDAHNTAQKRLGE